jgi:outer membrane receptor protein involved in Fe transport
LPLLVSVRGNSAIDSERFVDAEVGYRLDFGAVGSIDVTGFAGRYTNLRTVETAAPVVEFVPAPRIRVVSQFGNALDATTRGLEIAAHWTPVKAWRLDGSYSAFHVTPDLAVASSDPIAAQEDGSAPRAQWQLRTTASPGTRATLTIAFFHVGALEQMHVSPYTRTDINGEWRFTSRLSVMAIGQNLLDAAHAEFGGVSALLLTTQVPRSGSLRLRWTF